MASHDERIQQFCELTQASNTRAKFLLEAHGWDVEVAVTAFYEGDGDEMEDDAEPTPAADLEPHRAPMSSMPPRTQPSSAPKPAPKKNSRFASLADFREQDDEDDKQRNQYYAGGGERSGQMIEGAPNRDEEDVVKSIFESAQANGRENYERMLQEQQERKARKFGGAGMRLGEDLAEPAEVLGDDDQSDDDAAGEYDLVFWREGFTVNDGELRRYDDPANKQFLDEVAKGYAPHELSVGARRPISIKVHDKKDESYVPPPKVVKPFAGKGMQLGSPAPTLKSSQDTRSPMKSSEANRQGSGMELDPTKPSTTIQIRLADGTRMVAKMNMTHTVGDLRQFVQNSRPNTGDFALMTTFPNKELTDDSATIEGASLVNAVVMQKMR